MKMHRINLLFTLSSLSVLLVTVERFSFTGKILLQPYNFLRLHELVQMSVLILFTTLIPFFILYEVSHRFEDIKKKYGLLLMTIFITGVYFYATGNGLHELASFQLNTYCNVKHVTGSICQEMFFNDYYTGNILYFIGAALMNIVLLIFEKRSGNSTFKLKDMRILIVNSVIYAFAIFAYAAFDRVLVGFAYSLIMMFIAGCLVISQKRKLYQAPVTVSLAIAYSLATIASVFIRFL